LVLYGGCKPFSWLATDANFHRRLGLGTGLTVVQAGAADFALEPSVPGFDVVVSNPPYVTTEEMCTVEPELR